MLEFPARVVQNRQLSEVDGTHYHATVVLQTLPAAAGEVRLGDGVLTLNLFNQEYANRFPFGADVQVELTTASQEETGTIPDVPGSPAYLKRLFALYQDGYVDGIQNNSPRTLDLQTYYEAERLYCWGYELGRAQRVLAQTHTLLARSGKSEETAYLQGFQTHCRNEASAAMGHCINTRPKSPYPNDANLNERWLAGFHGPMEAKACCAECADLPTSATVTDSAPSEPAGTPDAPVESVDPDSSEVPERQGVTIHTETTVTISGDNRHIAGIASALATKILDKADLDAVGDWGDMEDDEDLPAWATPKAKASAPVAVDLRDAVEEQLEVPIGETSRKLGVAIEEMKAKEKGKEVLLATPFYNPTHGSPTEFVEQCVQGEMTIAELSQTLRNHEEGATKFAQSAAFARSQKRGFYALGFEKSERLTREVCALLEAEIRTARAQEPYDYAKDAGIDSAPDLAPVAALVPELDDAGLSATVFPNPTPTMGAALSESKVRMLLDHLAYGRASSSDELRIEVGDPRGAGNANHHYIVKGFNTDTNDSTDPFGDTETLLSILFQNGPLSETGVANGITNEALLAIVADRLRGFQSGPYACEENLNALCHVNAALNHLHSRTRARFARGVEGTSHA